MQNREWVIEINFNSCNRRATKDLSSLTDLDSYRMTNWAIALSKYLGRIYGRIYSTERNDRDANDLFSNHLIEIILYTNICQLSLQKKRMPTINRAFIAPCMSVSSSQCY